MTKETQLCEAANWRPAQDPTDTHELLSLTSGEAQPWFRGHSMLKRLLDKGLYLNLTRKFSHKVVLFFVF